MSCSGCSGAVERVLTKMQKDGKVDKFEVSLEKQQADVYASAKEGASYDTVLEKIKKTGKTVNSGTVVA